MTRKKVKVYFTDFWDTLVPDNNYFYNMLSELYDVEIDSEKPDILFYSVFGVNFLRYNCKRVFFTGENIRPNYDECDWSFSFDYSDNPKNYRLPLYALFGDVYELTKPRNPEQLMKEKTDFCNFIYSNPGPKKRKDIFLKLSNYKFISSPGRFMNNTNFHLPGFETEKRNYIRKFKFTFAFENSSYPGYTTEKLFDPLIVGSIPLYWGNPEVAKDFNPKSFINYHDYESDESFIEEIVRYDNDEDLYLEMLSQPPFENNQVNSFVAKENVIERLKQIVECDDEPIACNLPDYSKSNIISDYRYRIKVARFKSRLFSKKIKNFSLHTIKVKKYRILENIKRNNNYNK